MKKKAVKQPKKAIIIARVAWKNENKVCYIVRAAAPLKDGQYMLRPGGVVEQHGERYNSVVRDGERYLLYRVSFKDGVLTGCTCPAHAYGKACYVREQVALIEAARSGSTIAPAAQVETVATITEVTSAAAPADDLDALVAQIEADASLYTPPTATVKRVAAMPAIKQTPAPKPLDIAAMGQLNGPRAFSLFK